MGCVFFQSGKYLFSPSNVCLRDGNNMIALEEKRSSSMFDRIKLSEEINDQG